MKSCCCEFERSSRVKKPCQHTSASCSPKSTRTSTHTCDSFSVQLLQLQASFGQLNEDGKTRASQDDWFSALSSQLAVCWKRSPVKRRPVKPQRTQVSGFCGSLYLVELTATHLHSGLFSREGSAIVSSRARSCSFPPPLHIPPHRKKPRAVPPRTKSAGFKNATRTRREHPNPRVCIASTGNR